jgi:excisionase family DNA binding protein
VLTVAEVAERLNLSQSKVYELVERGELPHHRFGGAIRISEQQIAEYLAATKHERRVGDLPVTRRRKSGFRHLRT